MSRKRGEGTKKARERRAEEENHGFRRQYPIEEVSASGQGRGCRGAGRGKNRSAGRNHKIIIGYHKKKNNTLLPEKGRRNKGKAPGFCGT